MKSLFLILSLIVSGFTSCKTKKPATDTVAEKQTAPVTEQSSPKTSGKVSHQYKATGCATVILIKSEGNTITIIPKDKLPEKLDVDGLEISFDYRTLRMPNPAGCAAGIPAEITNISAK